MAVIERQPDLVRVLMQHGGNARTGIYPHRDATSALTLALERGYDDIVAIIREQEGGASACAATPCASTRSSTRLHPVRPTTRLH